MVSRKLAQRTNAWLIRVDFFSTYSHVNGLCFGYFQIFPNRSQFDQKLRQPLLPMYPDFLTIRYLQNLTTQERTFSNHSHSDHNDIAMLGFALIIPHTMLISSYDASQHLVN